MSQQIIDAAFESRLKTWASAQASALPIAFQNVAFKPPPGEYLRAYVLPSDVMTDTLDQVHRRYTGIFQVTLALKAGNGRARGQQLAAAIAALYPTTAPMTQSGLSIFITRPMSARPAITEPDRYMVPLTCAYRCDTV